MNALETLGIKKTVEYDDQFLHNLFYFMREFHFNPLDEEYFLPDGKVIVKKGISAQLFLALMEQMNKHYEQEKREYQKMRRK